MQEIGKEVVRKLKIIPAQAVVVEHVYYAMRAAGVSVRTSKRQ